MAYGFNRFLTTHTGSLPRPDDLIRTMFAKEEGVPVDRRALAARIAPPSPRSWRSRSRPGSISSATASCGSRPMPPTSKTG